MTTEHKKKLRTYLEIAYKVTSMLSCDIPWKIPKLMTELTTHRIGNDQYNIECMEHSQRKALEMLLRISILEIVPRYIPWCTDSYGNIAELSLWRGGDTKLWRAGENT